jgi:hypothetical protein
MLPRLPALAPILLTLVCGCSEPISDDLVGTWFNYASELTPTGYQRLELSFTASGKFLSDLRTYGNYSGQAGDDLSAFSRIEGSVRVEKDRMSFTPQRLVSWDLAYGPDAPEVVQEPYAGDPVYEDASYTLQDDHLTLRYTGSNAGFPVGIILEFTRAP